MMSIYRKRLQWKKEHTELRDFNAPPCTVAREQQESNTPNTQISYFVGLNHTPYTFTDMNVDTSASPRPATSDKL